MKIAFYPCTKKFIDIANVIIKQNKENELFFVGLKGYFENGDDISVLDNGIKKNCKLYDDFDKVLEVCDEIYFVQHDCKQLEETELFHKCCMAIEKGKKVYMTYSFSEEKQKQLRKVELECDNMVKTWKVERFEEKEKGFLYSPNFEEINTPIVYVGKSARVVNSDYAFLNVVEKLKADGYRIAAITENYNCGIFGYNLVDFSELFKTRDCDTCVMLLNKYLKWLDSLNKYDVIVLQLPQAATKYCNRNPQGFGVEQFIISESAKPDYYIHCMLCERMDSLEGYKNQIRYKFGYGVDAVAMNNVMLDSMSFSQSYVISLNYRDSQEVFEKQKEYFEKDGIYYGQSENDMFRLSTDIIDKLGE